MLCKSNNKIEFSNTYNSKLTLNTSQIQKDIQCSVNFTGKNQDNENVNLTFKFNIYYNDISI